LVDPEVRLEDCEVHRLRANESTFRAGKYRLQDDEVGLGSDDVLETEADEARFEVDEFRSERDAVSLEHDELTPVMADETRLQVGKRGVGDDELPQAMDDETRFLVEDAELSPTAADDMQAETWSSLVRATMRVEDSAPSDQGSCVENRGDVDTETVLYESTPGIDRKATFTPHEWRLEDEAPLQTGVNDMGDGVERDFGPRISLLSHRSSAVSVASGDTACGEEDAKLTAANRRSRMDMRKSLRERASMAAFALNSEDLRGVARRSESQTSPRSKMEAAPEQVSSMTPSRRSNEVVRQSRAWRSSSGNEGTAELAAPLPLPVVHE